MPYTTLLVHVDNSRHCAQRIRLAVRLAIAEGAHLIGSAMSGLSRYAYGGGVNALQFAPAQMQALRSQASEALHEFERIAREEGLGTYETRFVDDDAQGALLLQARYCDLLILGQTDAQDTPSRVIAGTPEYLMLHCGRPVLMVPHAPSAALCRAFGGPVVSTSANRHREPPARSAADIRAIFGDEADGVLDAPLGGLDKPTPITDAVSGAIIRA